MEEINKAESKGASQQGVSFGEVAPWDSLAIDATGTF
jgi:hypothetical protein